MRKIANTTELAGELERILDYAGSVRPSRAVIASQLMELSTRVAGSDTPMRDRTASLSSTARDFLKGLIALGDENASFGVWPQDVKAAEELEKQGIVTLKPTYRFDKPYTGQLTKKGWNQRFDVAKDAYR